MHPLDNAWEVVKNDFDSGCSQSARAARWELTNDLNQLLRRLRQYREEADWISSLMAGVTRFAPEAALFEVVGASPADPSAPSTLRLRAQKGLNLADNLTLNSSEGAAFASSLSSGDPVVAMRSATEVTTALRSQDATARAHVVPLQNRERVVALLFAAGPDYMDANALELIAGIASIVLERGSNRNLHLHLSTEPTEGVQPVAEPLEDSQVRRTEPAQATRRPLPSWSDLPNAERTRHLQAQRFARVTVAEFHLSQPEACRNGRQKGNLYLYLKRDLDRARENFRMQFMQIPSMVDYLHMELVSTAAGGDEMNLGTDYPGPLV